jgi:hypothetical protein
MSSHDDFIFNKLDKYFQIRLARAEVPALANQIISKLPPDEIFDESQLFQFVSETIGITNQNLIQQSIDQLMNQKELIMVEQNGNRYYRKMYLGSGKEPLPHS